MADDIDPGEVELKKRHVEESKPLVSGLRRLLTALLVTATLGGFAAVIWYAYNTGIQEGSEFAAPVLKPNGPSKVAPMNPGGQRIADQDKLVYGKIDKSTEGRKVERLLPPLEQPLPASIVLKQPPVPERKLKVPKAPPTSELQAPGIRTPTTAKKPEIKRANEAPAVRASTVNVPKSQNETSPTKVTAKPPPKPSQIAAKPDPSKGYRIQIGSFRSEAAAKTAWEKRRKQHGVLLRKLTLLVKRVDLNKRGVYYRVQAGPLRNRAAANRVCDVLKQKKIGCLVIRP